VLPDVADSMNVALLCHGDPRRSLILLSSGLPVLWGITAPEHDFGLGREEVLLFYALRIRMNDFAVLNLLPVALVGLRELHTVLELHELLEEDFELEVLIYEKEGLLIFNHEKYRLKVFDHGPLQRPASFQIDHHEEVQHVVQRVLADLIERQILQEVDQDVDDLV
jgi:hypothetical protein